MATGDNEEGIMIEEISRSGYGKGDSGGEISDDEGM